MQQRHAAALAVFTVIGLGAVRGASADEVVVLQDSGSGQLSRSDQSSPAVPVKGLEDDEKILAIDTSPATSVLFGITKKRLYAIDHVTGEATAVGPRFRGTLPAPFQSRASFDIRPTTDVGLVVQSRLSPGANGPFLWIATESIRADTGEATDSYPVETGPRQTNDPPAFAYVDGDPAFGEAARIDLVAFAANVDGPAAWTEFGIDTQRGTLVRIGSAHGLVVPQDDERAVTTIAPLGGLPAGAVATAFEIGEDGAGLLLVRESPKSPAFGVHRVDLATGDTTLRWDAGDTPALDVAVLPKVAPDAPQPIGVRTAIVRYTFRPAFRAGTSLEITGSIPMPVGGVVGRKAVFDIDGVLREFTLDAHGRSRSGPDRLKMTAKLDGTSRFTLAVRRSQSVEVGGVQFRTPSSRIRMTMDLFIAGQADRALVDLDYVIAPRSRGTAKLAAN